jgi:predicted phosphate transport protein (TIGR00153 family)
MFKNKKDKFAVMLLDISANLKESVNYFNEFKVHNVSDLKIFADTMRDFEHKADNYVHEMIEQLNHTFITPIDREDLLALTMALDDVLDGLEHCAGLREMFSLEKVNEYELRFVEEITAAVVKIDEAINLLTNKKLTSIKAITITIKNHESVCDNIYRQAVKELYNSDEKPVDIMKHKETYENLENVADTCQTVAHVLDQIVMKNV